MPKEYTPGDSTSDKSGKHNRREILKATATVGLAAVGGGVVAEVLSRREAIAPEALKRFNKEIAPKLPGFKAAEDLTTLLRKHKVDPSMEVTSMPSDFLHAVEHRVYQYLSDFPQRMALNERTTDSDILALTELMSVLSLRENPDWRLILIVHGLFSHAEATKIQELRRAPASPGTPRQPLREI